MNKIPEEEKLLWYYSAFDNMLLSDKTVYRWVSRYLDRHKMCKLQQAVLQAVDKRSEEEKRHHDYYVPLCLFFDFFYPPDFIIDTDGKITFLSKFAT
jgi:hypothetical protein